MSHELVIALFVFATAALFTPGPNNIMLMTSGLNYGFVRTLPHLVGVCLGFALLVAIVGFGFGAVFSAYPVLQTVLKYGGAAYLVYLAIRIALSHPAQVRQNVEGKPMTFLGAVLFQWVNVKGWISAVGVVTTYAAIAPYPANILVLSAVMLVVEIGAALTWAVLGTSLQVIIRQPLAVRIFNVTMALLLLASLYPVLKAP
ncbi:MAG: LysE family translocator [Xanthobacteraceae bacterium]|nr:LysE family translocator [Xanthobacteraceae bacterium]